MLKPALKNCAVAIMLLVTLPAVSQQAGGNVNGWFDVGEFVYNNSNVNPVDENFHLLQFDSGYYWLDWTGAAQPFNTFAAGHVFDLTHPLWSAVPYPPASPIIPLSLHDPFVWDSLRFKYFYLRGHDDTTIVDSLFIYYYCNFDSTDLQLQTAKVLDPESDSIWVSYPNAFNSVELSGTYFKKDTILLDAKDSTGINNKQQFSIPVKKVFSGGAQITGTYNGLFGYSLVFKPGSFSLPGDTLLDVQSGSAKTNLFGVFYIPIPAPAASQGWPPYHAFHFGRFAENSFWLNKNNRYGGDYNGKTGFIPNWMFNDPAYLLGAAHITATSTVSTKEINPDPVKLYPNPALPGEIITIETREQQPSQATVTITDILGRQVYSEIQADADTYNISAPLTEGIYTVTITGNNTRVYSAKLLVINK